MADETPPPTRGGNPLKNIGGFVKKHKMPVILAGGAGAFLFLSQQGKDAEGGDGQSTYGTIVPVMRELTENDESGGGGGGGGGEEDPGFIPDPTMPQDPDWPVPDSPFAPEPDLPGDAPAPVAPNDSPVSATQPKPPSAAPTMGSGVTISGTVIPGATARQQVGGGSNAYGKYSDWLVKFPSGSGHYYHYFQDENGKPKDKVTGPHDPKGTIPAGAKNLPDRNAPALPKPPPGTKGGGGPAPTVGYTPPGVSTGPATPQTQGYYQVHLMINKSDGWINELHHYTSGPRAGDVVNTGHVGRVNPNPVSEEYARSQGWSLATPGLAGKYGYKWQTNVIDIRGY